MVQKDVRNTRRRMLSLALLAALLAAYTAIILKEAWLCDDAFISFRTVDNFVNGFGLRWNISERVQAYTHPLWLFLVAACYGVTREIHLTVILLSVGLSCATAWLYAVYIARTSFMSAFGLASMFCSRAFVDYATSGLENPLTHLIMVCFVMVFLNHPSPGRSGCFKLALVASLGMLNRMDTGLLLLPAMLSVVRKDRLVPLVAGFFPVLVWEGFSLLYYGFPFPNTAYAKLLSGIPRLDLMGQGLLYLFDSVQKDPLTLLVALSGAVIGISRRKTSTTAIATGSLAYLAYVVFIGGDFMSGRFLTAPFLFGLVCMAQVRPLRLPHLRLIAVAVLTSTALFPGSALRTGTSFGSEEADRVLYHGIADERAHYYPHSRLGGTGVAQHPQSVAGAQMPEGVHYQFNVGYFGFYAGPNVWIIDGYGLTDPLLSRLPANLQFDIVLESDGMNVSPRPWRIGHFTRKPPMGYMETLESDRDQLLDSNVSSYFAELSTVTRGDLWQWERFSKIIALNLGGHSELIRPRKKSASLQRQAAAFCERRQWAQAQAALEEAIGQQTIEFELMFWLACITQRAGDPTRTLDYLTRVLEIDPSFSPAIYNRILLLVEAGRTEEAVQEFAAGIRDHSNALEALQHLIPQVNAKGYQEVADALRREALKVNPRFKSPKSAG